VPAVLNTMFIDRDIKLPVSHTVAACHLT